VIRYEDIQEKVEAYNPQADFDLFRRAYIFSAREHRGQTRRSGEPYLIHPLEVASILADLHLDMTCLVVGLLHDVVEDTLVEQATIEEYFGKDIAHIVEGVTKLSKLDFRTKEERQAENLRKMLLAMVDDIRVILVKLADRLHNMRTLEYLPPEKQVEIALETREIYAPIAHRLGIGRIKSELEDLALRHLDPDAYHDLLRSLDSRRKVSDNFIEDVGKRLGEAVAGQGIEAEVSGRMKSVASIHAKMKRQAIPVEQVYDYVAFRLVVPSLRDCYGALGLIHSLWRPVPGRFRDYIAMPKPNGYQSLHTSVISAKGQPFEVQIRTPEMHRIAEEGIAAHWSYKEGNQGRGEGDLSTGQWLRQYMELLKDVKDPREFLQVARMDLFPDEVYTFSPRGDVFSFPRGATVLDFAYAIHTDLGHQCVGARVKGKMVPLRHQLRSGDIVEIQTSPKHHPSRDSLRLVRTSKARAKIRQWLNVHERQRSLGLGREITGREFRRYRFHPRRVKDRDMTLALQAIGYDNYEDFLSAVGYGKVSPATLVSRLAPELRAEDRLESRLTRVVKKALGVGAPRVKVKGVDDVMASMAGCCDPIPGEEIVGYITRGRGVSVHAVNCTNVENLLYGSERRIDVAWSRARGENTTRPVKIRVIMDDRPGVLARITTAISEEEINIRTVDARVDEAQRGTVLLVLDIKDTRHLQRILKRLRGIEGIRQAERSQGA